MTEVDVSRLTMAQIPEHSVTPQSAIELQDGKQVLRYFVMWSLDPALKRLGEDLLKRLQAHFNSAKRYRFQSWSANHIDIGTDWHEEIQKAIQNCHFGLLLISPEFLGSKYIAEHELPKFIISNASGDTGDRIAIPVALKQFVLDREKTDLRGLDQKQIFFRENAKGACKAFSQEDTAKGKDQFALELYQRILRRFERTPLEPREPGTVRRLEGERDPLSYGNSTAPNEPSQAPASLQHSVSILRPEDEILGYTFQFPATTAHVPAQGVPSDLDRTEADDQNLAAVQRILAIDYLNEWLSGKDQPHYCALLGELGIGKTTTCLEWARQLTELYQKGQDRTLPIYFDLRWLGTEAAGRDLPNTLQAYLEILIRKTWQSGSLKSTVTPQDIVDLVQTRGALIIYDGLDEVLVHKTQTEGQAFIRELLRILPPQLLQDDDEQRKAGRRGHVLLTCRTHYFRTLRDQTNFMLGEQRESLRVKHYRAFLLLPFTEPQIEQYLAQVVTPGEVPRYLELIASVHNLSELAKRPLLLRLIAEQFPRLERRRARGESVNGATLYRDFVSSWLARDQGKHRILPEHKQLLMEYLAAELWRSGRRGWAVNEIEQWLVEFLNRHPKVKDHYPQSPLEILKEDLRTATFLVREGQDSFRFAHTSLQEFFLACHLQRALIEQHWQAWSLRLPSIETLGFLGQLLQEATAQPREQALAALRHIRDTSMGEASILAFRYGLLAHEQDYPTPSLAGFRLEGADVRGLAVAAPADAQRLNLDGICFAGAQLEGSTFSRVSLEAADFTHASLDLGEFHECRLTAANFEQAKLVRTVFRNCDVSEGRFRGSDCHRTQWLHCRFAQVQALPDGAPKVFFAACEPDPGRIHTGQPAGFDLFDGHACAVRSVAFSPDGRRLLSGSDDRTVKLWDAPSGECLRTLHGHAAQVNGVAFSPDGRRLLSGSEDGTIKLWDAINYECLRTLQGHGGGVTSVAFSPDIPRLLSGSEDGTIELWDATTGECLRMLKGHGRRVTSVAFSPDGRRVLSGSEDRTSKLWDTTGGECLCTLQGHGGGVTSVAFSPDGRRLLSGSESQKIKLWDAASGECLRRLHGHGHGVSSLAFSPDGRRLLSGSVDGTIELWDVAKAECQQTLHRHRGRVNSVTFSPDGRRLLSGFEDGTIELSDAASGGCRRTLQRHGGGVTSVAFSPDGQRLLSGSSNRITLWDAANGECLRMLEVQEGGATSLAFSPDGLSLLSGSWNGTIALWDAVKGECQRTLQQHKGRVHSVTFSRDGQRLLSGSEDGTTKLWDAASGECLRTLHGYGGQVSSVAFSPDGRRVLSGSSNRTIRLWDAASGECLRMLEVHGGIPTSVAFSPDGRRLLSGSWGGTIELWDANSEWRLRALHAHGGGVSSVAFSPDGRYLLSGSENGTIELWDSTSGECLSTLHRQGGLVTSVAFSPDGRQILAGDMFGLSVWAIDAVLAPREAVRICSFQSGAAAWWQPGVSKAPRWIGDAWRWLGWLVRNPQTGAIERYPIEAFGAATQDAGP